VLDEDRLALERIVDLSAELSADHPVADDRGEDNRDGNRGSCDEGESAAKRHQPSSRNT
jgi:hypothetical protein